MKQFIYCFLICFCFTACQWCDVCCIDCGEHGECDETADNCRCYAGYMTNSSGELCNYFSRDLFIGEWEAKDTLCGNDTCRQIPYTVYFYRHDTDSTLFYVKNIATQVCNNPDSAIWIASASNGDIRTFKHITQSFTKLEVKTYTYLKPYALDFYVVTNGDTLTWKTMLRKK